MVIPDLNLLVYAYNTNAPLHVEAKQWWEDLLNAGTPVALPAAVAVGFIRLMTSPRIIQPPMPLADAVAAVEEWLSLPSVALIGPGPDHWNQLLGINWTGPAVSDAHLAALALEHRAELHSADSDFAACSGLHWHNPLIT